ncbi:hypothetical protein [Subtercola boreus]|uniref:hypothetical protein n=1 Tax=Subtercola boreus TaxID=120213 RepID=UPI0011C07B45|nr:hypothetical protein [Subtercola boreus]
MNWTNFAGLRAHPLTDPDDASLSVMQGADWMITVSGRAGADVTGVNVQNPDTGKDVTATVAGGVWSAWWPITADSRAHSGLFGDYGDEITITYRTADGASHTSSGYSDSGEPSEVGETVPPTLGSLAGWSALPGTYSASAADVEACLNSKDLAGVTSPVSPVLAETRGDFVTLMLAHEGSRAYCTLKDGRVQWSADLGAMTVDPPAAGEAFVTDGNGVDGKVAGTRISALRGVAGSDVVAVVVHLAEGKDVSATVENGVWQAWWPENEPAALSDDGGSTATPSAQAPAPAGMPTISYTTRDGVSHKAG